MPDSLAPPALAVEIVPLLQALPGPRILVDDQFRILAANGAYYLEYGDDEGLIGRTCYEVSHHFDRPCDQCGESCPRTLADQSGKTSRVLHLHHTPHGEEYVDVELIPLRGADGVIRHYIEGMTPLRERAGERPLAGMVGRSPAFNRMLDLLHRVAPRSTAVLLLGESGTGKELAAQTLHNLSPRSGKPFVPVDCSGMTESLFESEMFGHERGAFTGANQRKIGLVEAAAGGTLFLDELGDIPLSLQVKLLRLLETGSYRRVGGVDILRADFRLVAATHRDLTAMVRAGEFRQDLHYRLSAFPIRLPPLRARREDLPALADSLLERLSPDRAMSLSREAMARLAAHDFPGNIRELRNILERAVILSDGDVIQPGHLRFSAADDDTGIAAEAGPEAVAILSLQEVERQHLQRYLAALGGDKASLASRLGISRRTLDRKLRRARA
ncbi:MAG: sigma-54-dependent Fis family transcriptional regulator [Thiobacillaceae bacterium]|jgi:DNA-binding NtrC family response regulator|nr:sigma-54-dependent Fis family transcriptional regulator [Thiobacillaceae bacterium]